MTGKSLKMLVDTGSAVSILPYKLYQLMFGDRILTSTTTKLEAYGGHHLQVHGVLQVRSVPAVA